LVVKDGKFSDRGQVELYLDDMTAARHRELVSHLEMPEALLDAAAHQAYAVIKWRSESPWSSTHISDEYSQNLRKLGKMYLRPGSNLRKTVVYVRPWLDPDPQNVESCVKDIICIAEEARLAARHGNGKVVVIADMSGLDFNLRACKVAATILQVNFPNLLERAFLVNVPLHARIFLVCILRLLSREKFQVIFSPRFATALGSPVSQPICHAIEEDLGEQVHKMYPKIFPLRY
jgi:hypothetical protein